MRKIGNPGEAQKIASRLDSMGYRHPDYVRSVSEPS